TRWPHDWSSDVCSSDLESRPGSPRRRGAAASATKRSTRLFLAPGRRRVHYPADGVHQLGPPRFLAKELFFSFRREAIELRALVRVGLAPFRGHPAFLGE